MFFSCTITPNLFIFAHRDSWSFGWRTPPQLRANARSYESDPHGTVPVSLQPRLPQLIVEAKRSSPSPLNPSPNFSNSVRSPARMKPFPLSCRHARIIREIADLVAGVVHEMTLCVKIYGCAECRNGFAFRCRSRALSGPECF